MEYKATKRLVIPLIDGYHIIQAGNKLGGNHSEVYIDYLLETGQIEEIREMERWRAIDGGIFYNLDFDGEVVCNTEGLGVEGDDLWRSGNYYRTESEARHESGKKQIKMKLIDWIYKNLGWFKPNYDGLDSEVYIIIYDYNLDDFVVVPDVGAQTLGVDIVFRNAGDAKNFIKANRSDLLIYMDITN